MRRPRLAELTCTLSFEFPEIRDISKPSVMLHKNGRYLLFQPRDLAAADVLREIDLRLQAVKMRDGSYFGLNGVAIREWRKVELWKHLAGDVSAHPVCDLLRSYGVEIGTSPTLKNYIRKEYRRRVLEATPYSAIEIENNGVSLFERCSVGANLLCIESFTQEGNDMPTFEKGKRYMVVRTTNDGVDKVVLCTEPVVRNADIPLAGEGRIYEWSALEAPMELYFDDSESVDFGPDIRAQYPDRIRQMEQRIDSLPMIQRALAMGQKHPLFEHVRIDAAEEALKRGVVNCKLMRMGKTSEAITICELWGSKTVAVIGTKNVRLAWRREFKRLGIKDDDYVMVNEMSDLQKPGKYYLMTYEWLRKRTDKTEKPRKLYENYLRAAVRTVTVGGSVSKILQTNPCPHCGEPMVRPVLNRDPTGKHTSTDWVTANGYICRNRACEWKTNNQASQKTLAALRGGEVIHNGEAHHGAAWATKGDVTLHHKPGSYVDYGLAAHASCSGTHVKGRQCQECKQTDGTWIPPRYRRAKDRFTAVVADEVHNAKEFNTQNAEALYGFRSRRKMAMTGTLLSNSPLDAYWPLLWAIGGPQEQFPFFHVPGKKEFKDRFCNFVYLEKPTGEVDEETGEEVMKTVRKQTPFLINPPDWWRMMQSKIKRRVYPDPLFQASLIEAGMKQPTPDIKQVLCPMDRKQAMLMLDALRDFSKQYRQIREEAEANNREVNPAMVIAKMTALRKIATVPERLNDELGAIVYDGPNGGGKSVHIKNLVDKAVSEGKKVLVLTDFQLMQANCQRILAEHNPIRLLTGWGDERRDEAVSLFNDDPTRKVFIAGTRAVRESIDLSVADVTICCDLLWSPAFQCQAWSRTMAPTKRARTCEVYLMLSQNSLDEHIFSVFYAKLTGGEQAMDRKVVNRRALNFDVKFFAERVLKEEEDLALQLRDADIRETAFLPELDLGLMEERV